MRRPVFRFLRCFAENQPCFLKGGFYIALPFFGPHGEVAQLVEQRTENPRVVGSIPTLATISNEVKGLYMVQGSPNYVPFLLITSV